jgi:hypothetical protein
MHYRDARERHMSPLQQARLRIRSVLLLVVPGQRLAHVVKVVQTQLSMLGPTLRLQLVRD